MSRPVRINGHNYTEFFAWLPTMSHSGHWIWLQTYYMRPDSRSQGRILTESQALLEAFGGTPNGA